MKMCIRIGLFLPLLLLGCTSVAPVSLSQWPPPRPQTGQRSRSFQRNLSRTVSGKYLLFLPQDYSRGQKRYPLIMYLHGGSLRGDDVEKVRTLGLPRLLESDKSFPFVVLSPLCPAGEIWTDTDMLIGILDEVIAHYSIDPSRVYLTGHSMGGRGAWYLAYKHPEKFAAVAPMSGGANITAWASRLKGVPVSAFHGAKDQLVPLSQSEDMVNAIKAVGGDVKFTVLPERDHYILDVYENKQLYEWFLEHKKRADR